MSLTYIHRRRARSALLLSALLTLVILSIRWIDVALWRTEEASGWTLLLAIVTLTLLAVRKRISAAPLGPVSTWVQVHLHLGIGSAALALLHVGWKWPTGWLEGSLYLVYWGTFVSGVVGLYLTRTIPKQLARTGEQVVYERIPRLRRLIADESQRSVVSAVAESGALILANFYQAQLFPYLDAPRSWWYGLRPTGETRRKLLSELTSLNRYFSAAERTAAETLFALVRKKDDLDFHAAKQGVLKGWLFGHLCLTAALLVLSLAHMVTVLAFRGGPG
jgi:hypothetical protein